MSGRLGLYLFVERGMAESTRRTNSILITALPAPPSAPVQGKEWDSSSPPARRRGRRLHPFRRLQEEDPIEMLARQEREGAHLVDAGSQVGAAGEVDEQSVLAQGVQPVFDRSGHGLSHFAAPGIDLGVIGGEGEAHVL